MNFSFNTLYKAVTHAIGQGVEGAAWLKNKGSEGVSRILSSFTPEQKELLERLFMGPLSPDAYDDYEKILEENEKMKREFERIHAAETGEVQRISKVGVQILTERPKELYAEVTELEREIERVVENEFTRLYTLVDLLQPKNRQLKEEPQEVTEIEVDIPPEMTEREYAEKFLELTERFQEIRREEMTRLRTLVDELSSENERLAKEVELRTKVVEELKGRLPQPAKEHIPSQHFSKKPAKKKTQKEPPYKAQMDMVLKEMQNLRSELF